MAQTASEFIASNELHAQMHPLDCCGTSACDSQVMQSSRLIFLVVGYILCFAIIRSLGMGRWSIKIVVVALLTSAAI